VFRKVPLAICTERLMTEDCWIGWDSVRCILFSDRLVLEESVVKLRYLLPLWDTYFEFHGEVIGGECQGGLCVGASNGESSL
jgi:hypothetical protein